MQNNQHQNNLKMIMCQTNIHDERLVRQTYFDNNKDAAATIIQLLGISKPAPTTSKGTTSIERTDEQKHIDKIRHILDEKDNFLEGLKKQIGQ